jgi:hypothetical protein
VIKMLNVPGAFAFILAGVDEPLGLLGGPVGVIQAFLLDDPAQQAQLILGVQDLEGLRQARFLPVHA